MKLAIINSCPLEKYIELGYTWVFDYYNPCRIFDEIWYYSHGIGGNDFRQNGFVIHTRMIGDSESMANEISKNNISVIRNYEAETTDFAIDISSKSDTPLVVSVH